MVDTSLMRFPDGLICCICFQFRTPDELAIDKDGQRWNVCKGLCAEQAGIEEREDGK